jgi:nucleotide-binding universal stress UspA family protein
VGSVHYDVDAIESAAARLVDDMVADAKAAAGPEARSVTVQRVVQPGGPATTLLDTAKDGDVIVLGRRGRGGFRRLLLGSVSEHVVRHAAGTVVVVPAERPTE